MTVIRTARRTVLGSLFALATVIGIGQAPSHAAAPTQYALTCIGTETDGTIKFSYRWGAEGEWKYSSVAPGKWQMLTYTYSHPGENSSPTLYIRYDDDLSDGLNIYTQKVKSYAASKRHCESQGYTYNFHAKGGELFLLDAEKSASL